MDIADVFATDDFFAEAFSDCLASGANIKKDGPSFVLKFPDHNDRQPFYVGFSLLESEDVRLFSDIDGFAGVLGGDEFMDGLDVLTAKMLSVYDGIDRGV